MQDLFMFCNDSAECVCEDKCCQECPEGKTCADRCSGIRYKEKIYSSSEFLADELERLAEKTDNWLILVAAEKIREVC